MPKLPLRRLTVFEVGVLERKIKDATGKEATVTISPELLGPLLQWYKVGELQASAIQGVNDFVDKWTAARKRGGHGV